MFDLGSLQSHPFFFAFQAPSVIMSLTAHLKSTCGDIWHLFHSLSPFRGCLWELERPAGCWSLNWELLKVDMAVGILREFSTLKRSRMGKVWTISLTRSD